MSSVKVPMKGSAPSAWMMPLIIMRRSLGSLCLLLSFIALLCCCCQQNTAELTFCSYEQPFYVNTTALSISTIIYNPSSHYSKWITRLLGQEAIFHNRSYFSRTGHPLSAQEKIERSQIFNDFFQLPAETILPTCSFEFTGFAVVDHAHPLSHRYMMSAPSIGLATLNFLNEDGTTSDTWKCYYRGAYETTNKRLNVLPEIHWPVFGYCPAPRADVSCLSLLASYRTQLSSKLEHSLRGLLAAPMTRPQSSYDPHTIVKSPSTITLPNNRKLENSNSQQIDKNKELSQAFLQHFARNPITLPVRLDMYLLRQKWSVHMDLDLMNIARKPTSKQRGVCAVLPYAAVDPNRRKVNEALAFEFIRYYSHLGFKVALYDREGRHSDGVFRSAYSTLHSSQLKSDQDSPVNKKSNKQNNNIENRHLHNLMEQHNLDLLYYNHTILQLLWPDMPYHNEEVTIAADKGKLSQIIILGDVDKRLTYTHCRSVLQHRFGIEQVLVVDIDEFLYCPRAAGTASSQRSYLASYIDHMIQRGVDQLILKQRVNVAVKGDMAKCMVDVIHRAENNLKTGNKEDIPSLFECVAAFQFVVKHFFEKSLHLNTACPFTSFHHASFLRYFDCYANSYVSASRVRRDFSKGGCSVVHLSTKSGQFNRTHPHDMNKVVRKPSELIAIAKGDV